MKITEYSINREGCSVCKAGEENYTPFCPAHRPNSVYYQYDYRDKRGNLFSTVASSLELCREKRDKWIQVNNRKRLFPNVLKMIQENKRLAKSEMAYQIGHVEVYHPVSIYWDTYKRDEIVVIFNQLFGTDIK